jgi:DNA repair protein RadC
MKPTRILAMKKEAETQNLGGYAVAELKGTYTRNVTIKEMPKVTSSKDGEMFLREIWEEGTIEHFESFYVLYLNRANKVIGWRQISRGGVAGTVADPKIIFQFALLYNACGMILAHNHPSGNMTASNADIELTKKVVAGARLLDMQVLDHVILGEARYFSFADEGML